ncbi:fd3feffe-44bc-4676-a0e9-de8477ae9302 [Sclerotinia trifoliorum]|uniref:Fd3feffe-44bc-4676-a0e9-de8477ae9302 n=1 Tax=Sclerotinia trifoliorum TaxID=28548 RepID=A0A8H2VMV5_9HELO|nr:fd3feffe-44bc-4676-a0e9-de8477ae9302 [Sclerotinia trifoliorum]
MESNEPTIIDLKSSFLRAQIFALSQPLQPSQDWQDSISEEENTLRQRAIDEALFKLNTILKQHNKISYPPQAQRHVAEQIDQLYWAAGERDVNVNAEEWSEKGADYRLTSNIEKLPEEWSEEAETKAPKQATKYRELQSKLLELNEKRRMAKEKLEQCNAAKKLLEPFEQADKNVQENLVTKNGEVEKELERMRMLMLRVERGIGGLERADKEDHMDLDFEEDDREKLRFIGII